MERETMKFIDYLRKVNNEESEFDACVGDVDMPATYCGDEDMYLDNPYLMEKYGEILNAECYIIPGKTVNDIPVCVVDDVSATLGKSFFMDAAGYCDMLEYSRLFEKTEEMQFPNVPEYQREYGGEKYYCVDVTDSMKPYFSGYFKGLAKVEISFEIGLFAAEEDVRETAKEIAEKVGALKNGIMLRANSMFFIFEDGAVLEMSASEEAFCGFIKRPDFTKEVCTDES